MIWEDALEEAKEIGKLNNLSWNEIIDEAKEIQKKEYSKINSQLHLEYLNKITIKIGGKKRDGKQNKSKGS